MPNTLLGEIPDSDGTKYEDVQYPTRLSLKIQYYIIESSLTVLFQIRQTKATEFTFNMKQTMEIGDIDSKEHN
jgi:hypothetical protein